MKPYRLSSLTLAVTLLAALSCTEIGREGNGLDEVRGISLRAMTREVTRSAAGGTLFPEDYVMAVSAWYNPEGERDEGKPYFRNARFVNEAGLWKEDKYWPLSGTLDFLAYACAGLKNGGGPLPFWDGNPAAGVTLTVADNSADFDDLLYAASAEQVCYDGGNTLLFAHAMTAVCFTFASSVAYDAAANKGITIRRVSIDSAFWGGTLRVDNPSAGGGQGDLSASWTLLSARRDSVAARVWCGNAGRSDEDAVGDYDVPAEHSSATFGDAYGILPAQRGFSFTVVYVLHNGRNDEGEAVDYEIHYTYDASDDIWAAGYKTIYNVSFTMNEITVKPTVKKWTVTEI